MASQSGSTGQNLLPSRIKLRSRGGCVHCKLRKRKCDEVKPSCGHCWRLNIQCEYPELPNGPKQQQIITLSHRQRMKMPIGYTVPSARQPSPGFESIPDFRIADYEDVRISFLLHNVFSGANAAVQAGIPGSSLTVRTELEFAQSTTSLTYNCLRGMATIYWGAVNKDAVVLSQGYRVRGQSLVNLRTALESKVSPQSGDLVAAIALMRLSDTVLPGAGLQWMIHAEALTQLCRAIGPEAFREPRMRRLLENNRWVMIAASSIKRIPVIFSQEAWKTVPWQNCEKDVVQTLLDVYTRLPNLRVLFDKLQAAASDAALRVSYSAQFQAGIDDMMLELQRWRETVDTEIRNSVRVWEYNHKLTTVIPLEPEQTQLSFQRMHHSYAMILFNMLVIILGQYLAVMSTQSGTTDVVAEYPKPKADLLTKLDLPIENPLQRAAIATDEMARIIPWIMQDRHKCAGALYIASPAVIADQFWQRFSQSKSVWFATVVSQVNSLWESYVVCNPDRAGELQRVLM